MPQLTYARLLSSDLAPEARVRQSLALLEDHFRRAALLALSDWMRADVVDPSLYLAIAGLQRPSWGSWNGLLRALRKVRKKTLSEGHAEARARVLGAQLLSALLDLLHQRLDPAFVQALKPLCEVTRATMNRRVRVQHALDLAITLRNRIAHDAPVQLEWWEAVDVALRPLLQWHADAESEAVDMHPTLGGIFATIERRENTNARVEAPWFTTRGADAIWSFNGVAKDFAVIYAHPMCGSEFDPTQTQPFFEAIQQLLGQQAMRERDLRRLLARAAPEDLKGILLGDLLVGRPIGEGGAATVHLGRQLSTGRKVAVKLLRDGMSEEARLRFQKEAAFLSKFKHPNIVAIIGYGEDVWRSSRHISLKNEPWFDAFRRGAAVKYYIILEWIDGETLEYVFQQKPRPSLATLTRWFAQAAAALSVVHNSGLIHRDVKPGNIMVTSDAHVTGSDEPIARLMDFGIARNQSDARTLITSTGAALGTDAYMPQEQIRSAYHETGIVGPAADIYALCATFYELMTGVRLYLHDAARADLVRERKLKGEPPTRPQALLPGFPWALETILMGGLQAEPTDRYRSAAALERDLRHVLADEPIEYRNPSLARRARLFYRRSSGTVHASAAVFLFFLTGIFLYVSDIQSAQQFATAAANKAELSKKETAKALAEANLLLAFLHEEEGRQAFLNGHDDAALAYLSRAYTLGHDATSLRYLLARVSQRLASRALVLQGHTAAVNAAAWSPDDRLIATGSADRTVRVWDSRDGTVLWTGALDKPVRRAVFSPDGRWLATQDALFTHLWDARTGAKLDAMTGRKSSRCLDIAFDKHGAIHLITRHWREATSRLTAERWRDGKKEAEWPLGDYESFKVAISPDGERWLRTDRNGNHPELIDIHTLETLTKIDTRSGDTRFTPDGRYIWHRDIFSKEYQVLDARNGRLVARLNRGLLSFGDNIINLHRAIESSKPYQLTLKDLSGQRPDVITSAANGTLTHAAFSPDGSMLAGVTKGGLAWIWETEGGQLLRMMDHGGDIQAITLNNGGDRLITVGGHRRALVWATKELGPLTDLVRHERRTSLALQHSGRGLWLGRDDGLLEYIELPQAISKRVMLPEASSAIETITPTPDGHHLVVISETAAAWILNDVGDVVAHIDNVAPTQSFALRLEGLLRIGLTFSPDSKHLAFSHGADAFSIWTLTGEHVKTISSEDRDITSIAWSPSGKLIALSGDVVQLWTPEGHLERAISAEEKATNLAFSPTGETLAVAFEGGAVRIFEVSSGSELAALDGHGKAVVRDIIFSREGDLITIGDDARALIWSSRDWTLRAMLDHFESADHTPGQESKDRIFYATLSPNQHLLATATASGDVLVWDTERGRLLERHRGGGRPNALAFSPDGRWLAIATDQRSRVWSVELEARSPQDIAAAAERVPVTIQNGIIIPKTIQRTR